MKTIAYTIRIGKTKQKINFDQLYNVLDDFVAMYLKQNYKINSFSSTIIVSEVDKEKPTKQPKEVAKKTTKKVVKKCCKPCACKRKPGNNAGFNQKDRDDMVRLRKEGWTLARIGKLMGVNESTIRRQLKK